jgi:hypothetical protein
MEQTLQRSLFFSRSLASGGALLHLCDEMFPDVPRNRFLLERTIH